MVKRRQVTVLISVPRESAAVLPIGEQLQFNQTSVRCKQHDSKLHLLYYFTSRYFRNSATEVTVKNTI